MQKPKVFKIPNSKFYLRRKQGFTLPEVIVAMGILVMVIISSTNLLVSIVRSNNDNVNTLVAYELAQEGLEAMRNIRDSDWLLNATFQGTIKTSAEYSIWSSNLPGVGETKYYALDYNDLQNESSAVNPALNQKITASDIHEYAPWTLTEFNDPEKNPDKTALFLQDVPQADGSVQKRYVPTPSTDASKSIFSRYLKVEGLGYEPQDDPSKADNSEVYKYRVTAVVQWNEDARPKDVRLTTELTDWKGGPL